MKKGCALTWQDKLVLQSWLRSGVSLAYVEALVQRGLVENTSYSDNAVRAFKLIWSWSAVRLTGEAGSAQARYELKCSKQALDKRIERARRKAMVLADGFSLKMAI